MAQNNQVTLDEALKLARSHHQQGNLMVAERTYKDILNAVPDHFPSVHYLGIVLFQRGNMPEALTYMQRATKVAPKDAECWANYGAILSEAQQFNDGLAALDKALRLNPDIASAHSNRAHTLWMLGQYKKAENAARKALALDKKHIDAMINLGNALAKQDKQDEAIKVWKGTLKIQPGFAKALNNIGNALRELGRITESEDYCRRAAEADPQNAEAWSNLGNALIDQGAPEEAEKCYRQAVSLRPNYAEAHNNLGIALTQRSHFAEALVALRYATSFRPDYADAYANMSIALRELGEYEQAETMAQQAVVLAPDDASHYLDYADILFIRERLDEATAALEQAKELAPDSARTYLKLASVLERMNDPAAAVAALDKAIALSGEMPELWVRKAQIYHIANQIPEAFAAIEKARALKGDHPQVLATLSDLYQTMGDMKQAQTHIRAALKINPDMPSLYFSLAKHKKFTENDRDFKKMKKLLAHENLGRHHACALHFALFKAYEDIGDDRAAFAHLKQGNDIKREMVPFDAALLPVKLAQMKKTYTKTYVRQMQGRGYKSDLPVFIVGMPRSGTTLTEQIISAHPEAFGAGELYLLNELLRQYGTLDQDNAALIGRDYVAALKKRDPSGKARRITDKMPGNFMRLPEIFAALPDAKIIHCRRDPMDIGLSCYKQLFAQGQNWSYNLEELAAQYRFYEQSMSLWAKLYPGRFLEFDYEDTVRDFENQARRLIAFTGLDWHAACLAPHKQKRAVLTASKAQVIKPVYTSSVKGWQRYKKELAPLRTALQDKAAPAKITAKKLAPKSKSVTKKAGTKKAPSTRKK